MPSCVVKSCKNYSKKLKKKPGITYHLFPKDKHRRDEWTEIIRKCRGDVGWIPSSGSTVCSAHFDDDEFKITPKGQRYLLPYSIPRKLLSKSIASETQTHLTSSTRKVVLEPEFELPLLGYCRFCATSKPYNELLNVHNDNSLKELVAKMLHRLNTNIDFCQEYFPTTICSTCVNSLSTAYDFVVGIDLAQITLKSTLQVSSNNGAVNSNIEQSLPISNMTDPLILPKLEVKSEIDTDEAPEGIEEVIFRVSQSNTQPKSNIEEVTTGFERPIEISTTKYTLLPDFSGKQCTTITKDLDIETCRKQLHLQHTLKKKMDIIGNQKKKLKILSQRIRRFEKRYHVLKNELQCKDGENT